MSECLIKMKSTENIGLIIAVVASCMTTALGANNRAYVLWPDKDTARNYSVTSSIRWFINPAPINESWHPAKQCFDRYLDGAEDVTYYESVRGYYNLEPQMTGYMKARLRIPNRDRGLKWVRECSMFISYTVQDVTYLTLETGIGQSIFIDKAFTWIWKAGPFGYLRSNPAVIPRDYCGRICLDQAGPDGEGGDYKSMTRTCMQNDYPDCRVLRPTTYPIVSLLLARGELTVSGSSLVLTRGNKTTFHATPGEVEAMITHSYINETVEGILGDTFAVNPNRTENGTMRSPLQTALLESLTEFEVTYIKSEGTRMRITVLESDVLALKVAVGVISIVLGILSTLALVIVCCVICAAKDRGAPAGKGLD